jgi:peptidoglycan/LPS O-acetylase OafA/YrhL
MTIHARKEFYLPELDLLRFFAFILVFLSHSVSADETFYRELSIPMPIAKCIVALAAGGAWGVDLFFALSAYLITTLLLREQALFGSISVRAFYLRRCLRIWPLYFGFLLTVTPILRWLTLDEMPFRYMVAFLLFVGNWSCAWWGYPHTVAAALWSVSIEEQFYLIWPLVVCRWRSALPAVIGVMVVTAFATRAWLGAEGVEHPKIWCNTLARLDPIAAGALVAVVLQHREVHLSRGLRFSLFLSGIVILAVLGHFDDFVGAPAQISYPIATLGCTAILIATIGAHLPPDARLTRWGCYLGRISYGLYVFHPMILSLVGVAGTRNAIGRLLATAAAFAATVLVAAFSYRFFELPFLRLKRQATRIISVPI